MKILTILHEDQFDEPPKTQDHLSVLRHQRNLLTTMLERNRMNHTISNIMVGNPLVKRIIPSRTSYQLKPNELEVSGAVWKPFVYRDSIFVFPDTLPERQKILSFWRKLELAMNRITTIKRQISTLERAQRNQEIKDLQCNTISSPAQIPLADIPRTIFVQELNSTKQLVTKTSFANPYFNTNTTGRAYARLEKYAGDPIHFPWSGRYKTQFLEMTKLIDRYGVPPLTKMYACTTLLDNLRNNSTVRLNVSFIISSDDNRIVWLVDAQRNFVYIDGKIKGTTNWLGDFSPTQPLLSIANNPTP